jgi:2-iminobutanoate/2-iminopropanoate deaminase
MKSQSINPTNSSYAQAMEVTDFKRLVFVSGQVPADAQDRVPESFREQTRLAWRNVAAQLAEAGMSLTDIVKVTIFLSERKYRAENAEVRHEVLGGHCPALTVIICGIYDEAWLLEIEAVAAG